MSANALPLSTRPSAAPAMYERTSLAPSKTSRANPRAEHRSATAAVVSASSRRLSLGLAPSGRNGVHARMPSVVEVNARTCVLSSGHCSSSRASVSSSAAVVAPSSSAPASSSSASSPPSSSTSRNSLADEAYTASFAAAVEKRRLTRCAARASAATNPLLDPVPAPVPDFGDRTTTCWGFCRRGRISPSDGPRTSAVHPLTQDVIKA
mmetsp:Transcript_3040/g.7445  ORF Transcript_3040/g.7445 Transcript_3040/m.7445 type:complete len:208 (+) Transcript_3040:134-757(+)